MKPAETSLVSIIVPTHNRSASVRSVLDALCRQTYPLQLIEVIVVADGCTDDTARVLEEYAAPFKLRVIVQSQKGAAAARNNGAAIAAGETLIFVDDDVLAAPEFVTAHLSAHFNDNYTVAIGYLPVRLNSPADLLAITVRAWWEDRFLAMRRPYHRFEFTDLFSGNFSMKSACFRDIGGFDPSLPRREDYELGARLLKAGAYFRFVPQAVGYHCETPTVEGALRRMFQEGTGDVLTGLKHPELRPRLPLGHFRETSRRDAAIRAFAFDFSKAGDILVSCLARGLPSFERLGLRVTWRRVYMLLQRYWYLRGIADVLGSRAAFMRYLQDGPPHENPHEFEIEIDLKRGLTHGENLLDQQRPAGARLRYGRSFVGHLAAKAGAEPLRGTHLRSALVGQFGDRLLRALLLDSGFTTALNHESANMRVQRKSSKR